MRAGAEQTQDIAEKAAAALSLASTMVLIGLAVALVMGIVLAIFITRSITGPIRKIIEGLAEYEEVASASGQVSSAAQSLAEGELRASRPPRSRRHPRRWRRCPP